MATTKDKKLLVIVDAGPIIHLDELEALDVLLDFERVLITTTVMREIRKHRSPIPEHLPIEVKPDPTPDAFVESLSKNFLLHAGETTALSLCRLTPGAIFATDDTAARLAGNQLKLRIHGTLASF